VPNREVKRLRGSDAGERDQRLLHSWPEWDTSIKAARGRLGFDPAWTPYPGADQPVQYREWLQAVELRRLLAEARRALIELHLPERFRDYWLACFLAPYERDGFAAILDPQPDGSIRAERVFPPPVELWFDAGIDYSAVPYKLVIEGPAALASTSVLRAAVRRALAVKQRDGLPTQHPLVRARQVGPVLENRKAARAHPDPARVQALRRARAWANNGDKPDFIAHRLGQRGYRVSGRTVRRWLDAAASAKSDTPCGQDDPPTSKA
jgi:hypothetical protein